jgi:hypothetical protein
MYRITITTLFYLTEYSTTNILYILYIDFNCFNLSILTLISVTTIQQRQHFKVYNLTCTFEKGLV